MGWRKLVFGLNAHRRWHYTGPRGQPNRHVKWFCRSVSAPPPETAINLWHSFVCALTGRELPWHIEAREAAEAAAAEAADKPAAEGDGGSATSSVREARELSRYKRAVACAGMAGVYAVWAIFTWVRGPLSQPACALASCLARHVDIALTRSHLCPPSVHLRLCVRHAGDGACAQC